MDSRDLVSEEWSRAIIPWLCDEGVPAHDHALLVNLQMLIDEASFEARQPDGLKRSLACAGESNRR